MTTFQIVFTAMFVVFIGLGVVVFALYTAKDNNVGPIVIWGTVDGDTMNHVISDLNQQDRSFQNVAYVQKSSATYAGDVINAMASGASPDIVLLSQDQILQFSNKLATIPYSAVSQSEYASSYIYEAQLFLNQNGMLALPFLINPLVMYWNRDLFTTAGIAKAPVYWNDLLGETQKLSILDASNNVKQSAIALGSWDNVSYAKAILSALFMQAGDSLVVRSQTGAPESVFGQTPSGAAENPASSALQFYTEFANPSKVTYSWNRALPNSQEAFTSGDLAIYLGFASDYSRISARNPNLRFAVALLPQIQGNSTHLTYGQLLGLAIPRTSANAQGALTIAKKLSAQAGIAEASQLFNLPPVRTDVAQDTSANAVSAVFYQSALMARGWLDPDQAATGAIFRDMVEAVVSNKSLPDAAVIDAARSFEALLPRTSQATQ